ncbi:MAG: restriction endonuclease [Caldilineaceae bacterium]|nr:restriction endonuclease [Caldilineaceae bacterium]
MMILTYGIAWGVGHLITARLPVGGVTLSITIGLIVLLIFGGALIIFWLRNRYRRLRAIRLADVDFMDGLDFEQYVCRLMEHQGYRKVHNVRGSRDFGVDILATRGSVRYAVQVKRYKGNVSRRAISDAVAGKYHFNCDAAMVVTNSYFTASAKELARSTGCELVDRDQLAEWILIFQRG